MPSGTVGTVVRHDDLGHVLVEWDNGQNLSLTPGVDKWHMG